MPAYIVSIPETAAPLVEGKRNVAVFAENAAAARLVASTVNNTGDATQPPRDYMTAMFAAATVTEIVEAADLEGAVLRVRISAPTPIDISITAPAGDDLDDICADMVTALNLDAQIANAAYSAGNLLTCADIADNIGDATLQVDFTLNGVVLSGFVGAIVHEGIAGAVLTCQMAIDTIALPTFVASF